MHRNERKKRSLTNLGSFFRTSYERFDLNVLINEINSSLIEPRETSRTMNFIPKKKTFTRSTRALAEYFYEYSLDDVKILLKKEFQKQQRWRIRRVSEGRTETRDSLQERLPARTVVSRLIGVWMKRPRFLLASRFTGKSCILLCQRHVTLFFFFSIPKTFVDIIQRLSTRALKKKKRQLNGR